MTAYQDILTWLRAATGPNRGLDVVIVQTLYPDIGPYRAHCAGEEPIFWHDPYRKQKCPKMTASLDASISLLRRLLPDSGFFVSWGRERPDEPFAGAMVFREMSADSEQLGVGEGPTLPLALLIALFEALQAREGAK